MFPFKDESEQLIARNIDHALRHESVDEVWGVAGSELVITARLLESASSLANTYSKPVTLFSQERIGKLRPGKGDAMNTALQKAASQDRQRVHFYDADITNFSAQWIEGAERAGDRGYAVVRHRFPRAATDAMITWFITRPGLATLFPGTLLPRLGQPLGGEFMVTGPALTALAGSPAVAARSDWGIDTLITYETASLGLGLFEHQVADGKRHALYGSLDELRDMAVECLDAICSLETRPPPPATVHEVDPDSPVPDDLKRMVGYDVAATEELIRRSPPSPSEQQLAAELPIPLDEAASDADAWGVTISHLISEFDLAEPAWRSLAFRLWVSRTLSYSRDVVPQGYDRAMTYLEESIAGYELAAQPAG